jgi:hypothetical protein
LLDYVRLPSKADVIGDSARCPLPILSGHWDQGAVAASTLSLVSVETCLLFTRLAAQRLLHRKFGQQTEEIAMPSANQTLVRLRQPNVLPFWASLRCYPGNLG